MSGSFGEPWSFKEWGFLEVPSKFRLIGGDQGGNPITLGFTHGYSRLDQETADRIVACVNALAGMDPAKLVALLDDLEELVGSGCPDGEFTCGEGECAHGDCALFRRIRQHYAELRGAPHTDGDAS